MLLLSEEGKQQSTKKKIRAKKTQRIEDNKIIDMSEKILESKLRDQPEANVIVTDQDVKKIKQRNGTRKGSCLQRKLQR